MISDIVCTSLPQIPVFGGDVYHILKKSDHSFDSFGEAYISLVDYQFVKGWKRHLRMSMNLVVPSGSVEFQFTDDFTCFRKFIIGESSYARLTVPPLTWFSFKGLSRPFSIIVNIASIEHDPDEVERLSLDLNSPPWCP